MELHGTTILAVRVGTTVAMAGDGQVPLGQSIVMKHTARKVRRLYKGRVLAAIGSGGAYAPAAARTRHTDAETVVRNAMIRAGELCVFTSDHLTVEVLGDDA